MTYLGNKLRSFPSLQDAMFSSTKALHLGTQMERNTSYQSASTTTYAIYSQLQNSSCHLVGNIQMHKRLINSVPNRSGQMRGFQGRISLRFTAKTKLMRIHLLHHRFFSMTSNSRALCSSENQTKSSPYRHQGSGNSRTIYKLFMLKLLAKQKKGGGWCGVRTPNVNNAAQRPSAVTCSNSDFICILRKLQEERSILALKKPRIASVLNSFVVSYHTIMAAYF